MSLVSDALYNRDILRLAASIPHQRRLGQSDASVEKSSPVCGSRITIDVVTDDEGRVIQFGQEVRACALGQAAAALMGGHVVGRQGTEITEALEALADYLKGVRDEPGCWPGLTVFAHARRFPARHASILLAFEAAAEAAALASAQRLDP